MKIVKDLKQVWSTGELDRMDVGKVLNLGCSLQYRDAKSGKHACAIFSPKLC